MIYLLFTFSSAFRCCLSCGFLTFFFFFLKNPPTTEIYPLPLHAPFPIYRLNRPKRRALGAALSEGVAGIETGPGQLRDHQELQADGTAADDQDGFACRYAGLLDGFQNRVDGLDEGGFFEADVLGNRHDAALGDPRHGFYIFAEAPAVESKAGGQASGLVLLALRKEATLAVQAFATWHVMKTHHAITLFPFADPTADGNHRAGQLVSEDLRRLDVAMGNLLDVRAADPAEIGRAHV